MPIHLSQYSWQYSLRVGAIKITLIMYHAENALHQWNAIGPLTPDLEKQ